MEFSSKARGRDRVRSRSHTALQLRRVTVLSASGSSVARARLSTRVSSLATIPVPSVGRGTRFLLSPPRGVGPTLKKKKKGGGVGRACALPQQGPLASVFSGLPSFSGGAVGVPSRLGAVVRAPRLCFWQSRLPRSPKYGISTRRFSRELESKIPARAKGYLLGAGKCIFPEMFFFFLFLFAIRTLVEKLSRKLPPWRLRARGRRQRPLRRCALPAPRLTRPTGGGGSPKQRAC